jgi:integrase
VLFDELITNLFNEYQVNKRSSLDVLKIRCNKHLLPFFGGRRASTITSADIDQFIVMRQQGQASRGEIKQELGALERSYAVAVQAVRENTGTSPSRIRKELGQLKRDHAVGVRGVRKKAGASNAEINRELAALKRAFSLAIRSGLLITKPYIPTLSENNTRSGFFERDQFEAIYRDLPEHVKPVAVVAYITGWRTLSELLPLEWRQVDFNAGLVRLDPGTTKNKEGRVFPFTLELRAVLSEQKAKTEALQRELGRVIPWVFHRDGQQFKSYRRAWKTACRKAALPGRIPHDFRRTAVRNLVRAGVPE